MLLGHERGTRQNVETDCKAKQTAQLGNEASQDGTLKPEAGSLKPRRSADLEACTPLSPVAVTSSFGYGRARRVSNDEA